MKKIYTYILMIACVIMFSSCQKEFNGIFTAEIEAPQSSNGKVYINQERFACWNNGDNVVVVNSNDKRKPHSSTVNINGNKATIVVDDYNLEQGSTSAYYGCSSYIVVDESSEHYFPIVEATQYYVTESDNQKINASMSAVADNDYNLIFRNLASILKFSISAASETIEMESIKLESKKIEETDSWIPAISGIFFEGNFINKQEYPQGNFITLSKSDGQAMETITTESPKYFYMCIPPMKRKYDVTLNFSCNGQPHSITKTIVVDAQKNYLYNLNVKIAEPTSQQ